LEKDKIEAILMGILLGMSNTETNQEVFSLNYIFTKGYFTGNKSFISLFIIYVPFIRWRQNPQLHVEFISAFMQPSEQINKNPISLVHDGHNKAAVLAPEPVRVDFLPKSESPLFGKRHRDFSACYRNLEHTG
jgi:hypothetical protein